MCAPLLLTISINFMHDLHQKQFFHSILPPENSSSYISFTKCYFNEILISQVTKITQEVSQLQPVDDEYIFLLRILASFKVESHLDRCQQKHRYRVLAICFR